MSDMKIRVIKHEIQGNIDSSKSVQTPTDLENSVLVLKDRNGEEKTFDIGCLCYRKFDTSNNQSIKPVEPMTLDKSRYPLVRAILSDIRTSFGNEAASKMAKLSGYRLFIKFINDNSQDGFDFRSTSDLKEIYTEYTKFLYTRMKFADGNPNKISNNSSSILQKRARRVVQLATGTDLRTVTFWATPIRWNDREKYVDTLTENPLTEEDILETYAAHCDFIHQAWSVLVKRDRQSVIVSDTVIFHSSDFYKDNILNSFFTKIATSALLSFIGASGANLTPLLEARMSDERRFEQGEIKGLRLSGIKYRGGIDQKDYTIVSKYLPIWRKWVDIRELMFTLRDGKPDSPFIVVGQNGRLRKYYDSLSDVSHHPAKMFQDLYCVEWVTSRPLRKLYASLAREATDNDIIQVAKMLGNDVQTAVRNYENINLADHAEAIRFAMNKVHDSAGKRVRDKKHIEVKIISDNRDDEKTTMIGGCESEGTLNPSLVKGFNDYAPQPDCRIKETCIFCDMYAAHADDIDIRKLLSFKLLITELGTTIPPEEWAVKWAPYEDRINEIFDEMRKVRPQSEQMIIDIEEEISFGVLDEYWADVLSDMYEFGRLTA
ncbi:hypothetical protein [Pseudomonas sp. 5Ae-yellow]|uniref:hypothetical protein n=1 Tax=Pseudomonas sp. 5Ae-yellow TaxID=2759848 RepID=UPI0015F4F5C1|nr:hypothetical protein [Pseudomonas sp. 5Ae-yellow]MBA6421269.1 hypothetical protein [Pseudomonas sp. 5Ae-yellow]|tara:strand:- start:2389 stop:4194 length:1806 start_codon:yes stop_codon:yes gene_type:complete